MPGPTAASVFGLSVVPPDTRVAHADGRSETATAAWKRRSQAVNTVAGGYSRKGGDDITVAVWAMGGPLTLTFASSIIHVAAAFTGCMDASTTQWSLILGTGWCTSYTLALGPVSACLIATYLGLFAIIGHRFPERSMLALAGVLFLWWTAAVGATTFSSVSIPDTLYFATWACLVYSALVLHGEWEQFQAMTASLAELETHQRAVFYVGLASIVNCAAAVAACAQRMCPPLYGYSVAVGPVSFAMCIALFFVSPEKLGYKLERTLAVALCVWWSVAVGLQTIGNGPFLIAGDGLFSAYAAFILSFVVAQSRVFPISNNAMNDIF